MTTALNKHLQKFKAGTATIGILGMGYVGQPLALRFAEPGYRVLGFDIDAQKVNQLNAGHSQIEHIPDAAVAAANKSGMACTTDFARSAEADEDAGDEGLAELRPQLLKTSHTTSRDESHFTTTGALQD